MASERLNRIRSRIAAAAGRVERDPGSVVLVAVSKGRSVAEIKALYEAGHRDFGENRSAEMASKVPLLPADIRWHFVGSLQSRKTAEIGADTWLLHSMDRPSLARRWAPLDPPPPCLLQVNLAREPQKHGVDPDAIADQLGLMAELDLRPHGLMLIPPAPDQPEDSRPWFRRLRDLRDELVSEHPELRELSMGMTDDFEVAIEEGATIIRVGRAIFGDVGSAPAPHAE